LILMALIVPDPVFAQDLLCDLGLDCPRALSKTAPPTLQKRKPKPHKPVAVVPATATPPQAVQPVAKQHPHDWSNWGKP
jgi:hypothetical protein